ncbi:MAG: tyrosine-type recombinase/integrase, partial [Pirellulaceae bacterium]
MVAKQAKTLTFDEATKKFMSKKGNEFRNRKHAAQWTRTLETYAGPVIGSLSVSQIELAHIVSVLDPIWTTKTETATRLRGRIEAVLNWATVSGYRTGPNPAQWRGNLDALLAKPGKLKNVQHHRALAIADTPAFLEELRKRDGMSARALEFIMLTATRSGEVRGAKWPEIDFEAEIWTVPAARMKAGREHLVPLSVDALELLKGLPRHEGCAFVFASPRLGQLSDMSISAVMRRMEVPLLSGLGAKVSDLALSRLRSRGIEVLLKTRISKAWPGGVQTADGQTIATDTVIWVKMVVCIPSGSTEVEVRAVRDSAEHAGGREVYMIY